MGPFFAGTLRALAVSGLLLAGVTAAGAISISGNNGLTVTVNSNGTYEITLPSPAWRFTGSVGGGVFNLDVQSGSDQAGGGYNEISFDFSTDALRHASIRTYFSSRAVRFFFSLPAGGPNTFSFPAFGAYPDGLSHVAFSGVFAFPTFYGANRESPWIGFDSSLNTMILSPAANFMVAGTAMSNAKVSSGISSQIASLPQGFTHQTLMVVDSGINRAFDAWGHLLTGVTGKVRPANDADVTLSRLGYWTDAGASYYYSTEPGLSYPETLAAVKADFEKVGIPLGYLQLDSWFYPKGAASDWLARADGIYEYLAADPPFQTSLASFQKSIGLPLITHSRWIDPQSPYRQRFRMSGNVSIDPLFWGEISRYLSDSGVVGFEQDWLFDRASTDFNLTDGDAFLDNMASALARENLTIQYCSGTARHFLQSAKYSNLTTIRVSEDRFDRTRWSKFLYASRLAGAVGVWPFTDVLMTAETGNMLLATLSAGPVGVGDRLGTLNAANLRRAVRADGVIVKPDVPVAPIDASFINDAHSADAPMIAATYVDFGGSKTWYLFLYPQGSNTQARFRLSDVGLNRAAYLYDYFDNAGRVVGPNELLTEDAVDFRYQVAAPIGPSGIAILGDTGHFVTLGKKRVTSLTDDGEVRLSLVFAKGELSRTLMGYSAAAPQVAAVSGGAGELSHDATTGLFTVEVTPDPDGAAALRFSSAAAPATTAAPGNPGTGGSKRLGSHTGNSPDYRRPIEN